MCAICTPKAGLVLYLFRLSCSGTLKCKNVPIKVLARRVRFFPSTTNVADYAPHQRFFQHTATLKNSFFSFLSSCPLTSSTNPFIHFATTTTNNSKRLSPSLSTSFYHPASPKMGRQLQKKKNKSSIPKKSKHKNPRIFKVRPTGNALIAANWFASLFHPRAFRIDKVVV